MPKSWRVLFFLLLMASLSLNLYLLSSSKQRNSQEQVVPNHVEPRPLFTSIAETLPQVSSATTKTNAQQTFVDQSQTQTKEQLLEQANRWFTNKNLVTLEVFLQDYLKQHPQDMDFLLIEAQLKVETSLLSDAINHYYDLLRMPMSAAHKEYIEQQINTLTSNTIEQLTNNYSWDILARFVEPLLQLEPNNRQYILSLARAYAELFQAGLAENILASLKFDDPQAQKVRQILIAQQSIPTHQDAPKTSELNLHKTRPIPLTQLGDHYLVKGSLSSNPVTLLIDTGASITAISRDYYNNLSNRYKVNFIGRFHVNTAGGRVMAPMYQFRELTIQQVSLENLAVVVIPLQGMDQADGLLGMNFLREFDFKIDQTHSVLFLN